MNENNSFSTRLTESSGRNEPNKIRFAIILMCDANETDRIIDLINQNTKAFIIYRRIDTRPLWVTTTPPPRESKGFREVEE